ncbi:MAG: DUF5662 family protein [Coriobacteriia bacterium]|nr:DUF5662 family protein [Coriobacteriia bacterium]
MAQQRFSDESSDLADYPPTLAKAWGHFRTITKHKLLVMRHCFRVGLYKQGLLHDLSKYAPVEFTTGARFYTGVKSPNAVERRVRGLSEAWCHHKGRNRHHFEYWIDLAGPGDHRLVGKPMPTRYVVEMFCDRVAACKVYEGDDYTDASALRYFQSGPDTDFMHPDSVALLVRMLSLLAEQGEDVAFRTIRRDIVKTRYAAGESARW